MGKIVTDIYCIAYIELFKYATKIIQQYKITTL